MLVASLVVVAVWCCGGVWQWWKQCIAVVSVVVVFGFAARVDA